MNDKGFFGKAYDFDRDGKLNSWERAADTIAFQKMCEELDKPVEQPYVPQK